MSPVAPIRLDVQINLGRPAPAPNFSGWRCLHTAEDGRWVPLGMPEERTPDYARALQMTEAIQRMSYRLMTYANPTITARQWTDVHQYDRCFNNGTGFKDPYDPRANFITGENLSYPLPAYDKAMRICGGTFVRGDAVADKLVFRAGVHGIDGNGPMPDPETIIRNHWYTYAVSVGNRYDRISHFPQGNGGVVLVPFIFRDTITFPLAWFERWESDALPDPLRIYR